MNEGASPTRRELARDLQRGLLQRLSLERAFGRDLPLSWPPSRIAPSLRASGADPAAPAPRPREEDLEAERARRRPLLASIDAEVRACRSCVLCEGRRQTVFGVGDPCARLLFIGEAPGEDEDRQGEPFVGPAGQLLTRMIQAMGLERGQVYIANIVKCRPPSNRNPEPKEIISCLPYLRRQIEIIQPELICTLGNVATRTILETVQGITRLRGKFQTTPSGIPVLPTFHPSYLLRTPADKRLAWEDLQKVMERLGLPKPAAKG